MLGIMPGLCRQFQGFGGIPELRTGAPVSTGWRVRSACWTVKSAVWWDGSAG